MGSGLGFALYTGVRELVTIPTRFCGPPQSANGGYTAGLLAELFEGPCEVTLRAPPPLGVPLSRSLADGGATLLDGELLLAEAKPASVELELPAPVTVAEAERAVERYPGFARHPFPRCFVCGTAREPGDGLTIFTGPVGGRDVVAAPWSPTRDLGSDGEHVDTRFVWAALDCPSWFGFVAFADEVPAALLGRLSAVILRRPRLDERCVLMGWCNGREGRRIACGSQLLDASGECLAYSKSTWVVLK